MSRAALVFYPEIFVGFNKTQLIERQLVNVGFIGSRFRASPAFTTGSTYRQFIPKIDSLYKYQHSIIRIHIQSTGQWFSAARLAMHERSNLVIIEGDSFIIDRSQCSNCCQLLGRITGDEYKVEIVEDLACLGISELAYC
ncbi:hypothetical protein D0C16_01755 [Cellvibrio sp. KY-GH-1]|uniref:hypothetical protein n=1 Tax=Cellvibrio sp. KY-GH-1 TaxID=2303332 RepID=UPI001244BAFD|nr:hypothetical protein [Cellvibrio sp. KY-GH-1]QEY14803.1 hypothetical protein D0C16_01755 [Cellvibrio sp. KY-GH-1]